jgi:peptide/nickel transport system permease protein
VAGGGFWTVVIAIAFALTPYIARVAYNITQTLRSSDFVVAAQATGESGRQVLAWELLPNVLPAVIVYVTSLLGTVMVVASGLSFFGLGVAPPAPEWGQMINEGRVALSNAPLVSLAPGAMIVIAALCFSSIGDGVRDVLDPRS